MTQPTPATPAPPSPRRILVLRPGDRLGNAVLCSGLLADLRRCFPAAELDWLLEKRYAPLFADNPHRVRVLAFDKRALFSRPDRWLRFMAALRRRSYDAVIDAGHAHAPSRTALWLMRVSAAPLRVGHAHPKREGVYTHPVAHETDWHDSLCKHGLLRAFGPLPPRPAPPWVAPAPLAEQRRVDAWLDEHGLVRPVLLWPGSRKPDRRLDAELWCRLLKPLAGRGEWMLGWGPGEEERAALLAERLGIPRLPLLGLLGLSAICARASAYIGHDTGPLHLAVANGCATACLYPPGSEAARWAWPTTPHLGLALDAASLADTTAVLKSWLASPPVGQAP